MKEKLFIGLAEESITPDKSINLAGQFYERISEYVETPITATAMAVKTDTEQMVILSCDMTKILDTLLDKVREKLKGYKDLDVNKVMINATHAHTSHTYDCRQHIKMTYSLPILEEFLPGKKYLQETGDKEPEMTAHESTEFLVERLSLAVKKAWDNLKPAYIGFGFGRAAIGMCRRAVYEDGHALMWGDTDKEDFYEMEGVDDSGIEIGFVFGEDKRLEGVIANVACPSQILEHRNFISSDYWGKVRILLREKFGEDLKVVALCSAAGDMCPRDLVRWVEPETPIKDPNIKRDNPKTRRADPSMFDIKGTWKAGRRIAREIIDAYEELCESGEITNETVFAHKVMKLDLPLRRVSESEYTKAKNEMIDFAKNNKSEYLNFADDARMHVHAGIVARYRDQQRISVWPSEVHVVRLGDVAFATNPFELFLEYGNKIRARSNAAQTFLIQLCCGGYSYLPSKKAERGSHYSAYVASGFVGHEGGAMLVEKTLDAIDELFKSE